MMVSLLLPGNRHTRLGASDPATGCSVSAAPLQPACWNSSLILISRALFEAGASAIRCKTTDLSAGVKRNFCAGQTPHTPRTRTARAGPRIGVLLRYLSRLSYRRNAQAWPTVFPDRE